MYTYIQKSNQVYTCTHIYTKYIHVYIYTKNQSLISKEGALKDSLKNRDHIAMDPQQTKHLYFIYWTIGRFWRYLRTRVLLGLDSAVSSSSKIRVSIAANSLSVKNSLRWSIQGWFGVIPCKGPRPFLSSCTGMLGFHSQCDLMILYVFCQSVVQSEGSQKQDMSCH